MQHLSKNIVDAINEYELKNEEYRSHNQGVFSRSIPTDRDIAVAQIETWFCTLIKTVSIERNITLPTLEFNESQSYILREVMPPDLCINVVPVRTGVVSVRIESNDLHNWLDSNINTLRIQKALDEERAAMQLMRKQVAEIHAQLCKKQ